MGCIFALANPDAREMWREGGEQSCATCFRPAKQGIRRRAVGSGFVAVRFDANDLGFEQCDSLRQFGLRVRGEVFAREAAGCIAPYSREVKLVHLPAASQGNGLAVNP